jgi:hypothetical protein
MHALHLDHRVLLAGLLAFLLAVVAWAAPGLGDLSLGRGGSAPVTAEPAKGPIAPVWVSDPVAPPALLR